jgi:two-component system sensor histidine kinase UhpB
MTDYLRGGAGFRIWPALVMPETLLFAAQAERPGAIESPPLADKLLERYFRLENAERRLAVRMRRLRKGCGASALGQVERERQRLGRELHTGVGQLLAAISLQLDVIAMQAPDPAEPMREALARIRSLSQEALQEIRGISRRLYPPEWQRLTLEEALTQLWKGAGISQRFDARMYIEPLAREPEQEIKVLLYRAAQEALSNIARHSEASQVEMTLKTLSDRIVLTLGDNGKGFDAAVGTGSGLGLRSIRDAAAETGAKVEVESSRGSTMLRVWAPFEAHATA